MMALWIGVVIPFCLFYYEADSEMSVLGRLASGAQWTVMILIVSALVLGLGYGLAGYVDYPVQPLYSGLDDLSSLTSLQLDPDTGALRKLPGAVPALGCDALVTPVGEETWTLRPSFLVYVIA